MYSFLQTGRGAGGFLKLILAILGFASIAHASNFTEVVGTVIDPNGIPYSNGSIQATLIISGSPRFADTGFPYVPPTTPTALDAAGHFEMNLADVTKLIPTGGLWTFHVCSGAGSIPPGGGTGPVCFDTPGILISGDEQDITSILHQLAPPLTGGPSVNASIVQVNGLSLPIADFNGISPAPPANGRLIQFNSSGSLVSAALVGDGTVNCLSGQGTYIACGGGGGSGVASINGATGALSFPNVTCTGTTCALSNPVVLPLATARLTSPGTTVAAIGVDFSSTCCAQGVPAMWANAPNAANYGWQPIPYIVVNGITPANVNAQNFTGPSAAIPPAVPTNGINVTWTRTAATGAALSQQQISAAIIGDGVATHCLVGTGTFAACPSGTGQVGSGNTGFFAFYPTQGTAIVGSNVLSDINGEISSVEPITTPEIILAPANARITTNGTSVSSVPSTVSGAFGFLNGVPAISTGPNQPFTAIGTGGGGGIGGSGTAGTVALFTAATTLGNSSLTDNGTTVATTEAFATPTLTLSSTAPLISAPSTLSSLSLSTIPSFSAPTTGSFPLPAISFNGSSITLNTVNFSNTAPAAPTNGKNVSWQRNLSTGEVSAALIGDGSTNCLSGQGTYIACGSSGGGSGTVGTGVVNQFAIYNGTNSIVGSPQLTSNGTNVVATTAVAVPQLNLPSATLPATTPSTNVLTANTSGNLFFSSNGGVFVPIRSISINAAQLGGNTVAGAANFNNTIPTAPTNGRNITWNVSGVSTSAALVGDGSLNCLSGQGSYVTCGGGAGGIGGSGSAGFIPVFATGTTLANSPVSASANTVIFGSPSPLAPAGAGTLIAGVNVNVNGSTPSCAGAIAIPLNPNANLGCVGERILYNAASASSTGANAGLIVQSNGSSGAAGLLGMGIVGTESSTSSLTEMRGGYFESLIVGAGTVTTNRGLFSVALNDNGTTTGLNEAVVAQSGGLAGGANTNDFTMHCLAPLGPATLTTHACMKIEPQGTGVELQTGAHTFASLPLCSTAYEGSMAAITDGSASSGTVAGGGSNHVLIYCNGTNWTAAAGGGGGGGGTSLLSCTIATSLSLTPSTFQNVCSITYPASASNRFLHCNLPWQIAPGSSTDVSLSFNLSNTAVGGNSAFTATVWEDNSVPTTTTLLLATGSTGQSILSSPPLGGASFPRGFLLDGQMVPNAAGGTINIQVDPTGTTPITNMSAGGYCTLQ